MIRMVKRQKSHLSQQTLINMSRLYSSLCSSLQHFYLQSASVFVFWAFAACVLSNQWRCFLNLQCVELSQSLYNTHTNTLWNVWCVILILTCLCSAEDEQNEPIVCVWCQKEGMKRYSLLMGSELKSFCSEKCFAACRRAFFKHNKVKSLRTTHSRNWILRGNYVQIII